jgi:NAD(P)-dependent dehydrogenase (short-subunit alcohol dehydrogenase family)
MSEHKTAIVTGAGSGIGAGIAACFAAAGYQVALLDIHADAAQRVAAALEGRGRRLAVEADVSDEAAVAAAVARVAAELGPIDALVNNAGIEIYGTAEELTGEQWDRTLAVNLKGAFLCSKYAIPRMRPGAAIVNISSAHAWVSWPRCTGYDASKAGMLGLTRAMALDCGQQGIRVNAICPGYIDTPLLRMAMDRGEFALDKVLAFHPLGRIGTPEDIAQAALFLCSPAAGFISGATLAVDGCLTASGL